MTAALPASTLPPAQPVYVLRGHAAAIHTLLFFRQNSRLLTGDADGWIVVWSVVTKRAVAVWRAHEATVLGAETWDEDKLITHGRDGRLCVWSLSVEDEETMSKQLPIEAASTPRKQPWLLHILNVPTMNFCSFASCIARQTVTSSSNDPVLASEPIPKQSSILIAVSGSNDSQIDLYQLPSEEKIGTIPAPEQVDTKTGMVMVLKLFYSSSDTDDLFVIAGYESGRTYLFKRVSKAQKWEAIYTSCPHSQPILSLDISPTLDCYYTSSADAIIAKHPLLQAGMDENPLKQSQTQHAGQQGLKMRSDGRIFATAGWDSRARVYSAKSMKELAVLKWHKDGCYAIAFGEIISPLAKQDGVFDASTSTKLVKEAHESAAYKTVQQARGEKTRLTHWLAVGAKDGKVSLWDIY